MTHAYNESYLSNAKDRLSSFFNYAINDCKIKPDWITVLFINTGYAEQFERGNPAYVVGMSGVELARAVILKAYGRKATILATKIIGMYSVYHEMDITNFIDTMEEFYKAAEGDSNLKRIRESRGLSQSELAEQSGIKVRNIQMYEQRVNNIDKAQVQTLYKLSRVLGCDIEDLLENPMM